MTIERWKEVKAEIQKNFQVDNIYEEDLDPGKAEVLEFIGNVGKMKVKFIVRPKVLDKKTSYSNRAGSQVRVDYVFSEDENVSYLEAYLWQEEAGDWRKIEAEKLF